MHRPAGDLIEREDQLRTLRGLLSGAVAGSGRTVVLGGASGNGKSVLLDRVRQLAGEAGADVATAIAARAEQSLPLGVVGQLAEAAGLGRSDAPGPSVGGLLDAAMSTEWEPSAHGASCPQAPARMLHGLCMAFLRRAEQRPIVLCVDDVHHADAYSMQFLSYLSRRVRATPLLMVLTELPQLSPVHPAQYVELLHGSMPIALPPLTRAGVARLAQRLPATVEPGLDGHLHAFTGGNPRLAAALVEDMTRRAEGPYPVARPAIGEAFIEAVRACLFRSPPPARPIAHALAVTGGPADAPVLARLLDLSEEMVNWGLLALRRVGLLTGDTFRDPRIRMSVLAGAPAQERVELHRRLAVLGHATGESPVVVARHLLGADGVEGAWVAPTLRDAASQALAEGRVKEAVSFLDSAGASEPDARRRAEATLALTRAEWQFNPADAARRLPELLAAVRHGQLVRRQAAALVPYLLWHGLIDDAVAVVNALTSAGPLDDESAAALGAPLLLLTYLFPGHAQRVDRPRRELAARGILPASGGPLPAAAALTALAARSTHAEVVAATEQVVRNTRLDHEALGPISVVMLASVLTDRLGDPGTNDYPPLHPGTGRRPPTAQALLSAMAAEGALRRGDLAATVGHAGRGLDLLPAAGWGIAVGGPLSNLVLAATAGERDDEATAHLAVAVPAAMFDTPFGLKYLHARGRHHLRTGCVRAALVDLQACGRLTAAWDIDQPELVPWRTELARAQLALGRPERCRELALEQLDRLPEHNARERGAALWALATASEPADRLPLLRQAVALLRSGADVSTGGHAAATAAGSHGVGGPDAARPRWPESAGAPDRRDATPRPRCGPADEQPPAADAAEPGPDVATMLEGLTEAERRVATLAADGHTNRAIAARLFVTVSTVEQHLTRVYRKLRVNSRGDLLLRLGREATRGRKRGQVSAA
ncbi:AAA family ATPase [Micromonospora sp. WMMD1128]|uniref:ATP-binding protein n=1 Tax=Micromonospora sp. WMMD1128 TaxID=3015150 RepID=UPI00248B83D6|nr:LuxR family transcriptional regulator [Micromonospora sp. WMMD1128]WBB71304.1 AAA family ATPase [Micromonospora sp. WMMD1128]